MTCIQKGISYEIQVSVTISLLCILASLICKGCMICYSLCITLGLLIRSWKCLSLCSKMRSPCNASQCHPLMFLNSYTLHQNEANGRKEKRKTVLSFNSFSSICPFFFSSLPITYFIVSLQCPLTQHLQDARLEFLSMCLIFLCFFANYFAELMGHEVQGLSFI